MWELSILANKNIFLSFCVFMWIEKKYANNDTFPNQILFIK